ncbi:hypothetical protein L596_027579 [Steinernema carpocapsae]|uniref:Uncharacterized protein n=1 Tax=Steinernema carpocapsae TaxID=34508 RepID=A0A4U5LVX6_STECR|nr:hypothetical protein L596_027579 [Steinernema carpocapsae]
MSGEISNVPNSPFRTKISKLEFDFGYSSLRGAFAAEIAAVDGLLTVIWASFRNHVAISMKSSSVSIHWSRSEIGRRRSRFADRDFDPSLDSISNMFYKLKTNPSLLSNKGERSRHVRPSRNFNSARGPVNCLINALETRKLRR